MCAAPLLTPPLTYPHPLPTCTTLTGTGSQPPEEAAQNDAGRLKCRLLSHHKGKKQSPFPLPSTHASTHEDGKKQGCKTEAAEAQGPAAEGRRAAAPKAAALGIPSHPFPFIPRPGRPGTCSSSSRIRLRLLTTLSFPHFLFFQISTAPSPPRPPPQPPPPHTLLPPSTQPRSFSSPWSSF